MVNFTRYFWLKLRSQGQNRWRSGLAWCGIALLTMVFILLAPINLEARSKINPADCTFNGHRLYGKIQLVDAFPEVTVQVVTAFPDLKVQLTEVFPTRCGQWQMVDVFPDTKVKIVDAFPDVKIQYVDVFPGLP